LCLVTWCVAIWDHGGGDDYDDDGDDDNDNLLYNILRYCWQYGLYCEAWLRGGE
jgi:hypothetical protein